MKQPELPANAPSHLLLQKLEELNREELHRLAPSATPSHMAIRRQPEQKTIYRQQFALDADRILHSRAYTRYIDKTQVFSLISNDHITHRVLHVQLVSRIARTIGRFLHLNEDLIEAIALGHDIGHPPFGHDGEKFLSELCIEHDLPPFQHNIMSVRFLDDLERKGKGWNLTLQVLDGILCHDGEIHSRSLSPEPLTTFQEFDHKQSAKERDKSTDLLPATLEGCVVRLADTVAYIGKDIEDAIILNLIQRADIPSSCRETLGDSNGTIVYTLVTDLINNSDTTASDGSLIGFSEGISTALQQLKAFNYKRIYLAPETKRKTPLIRNCYRKLFDFYLKCLKTSPEALPEEIDLMADMTLPHQENYLPEEKVRDFIAGMTDDYFLKQAKKIGCLIPMKK